MSRASKSCRHKGAVGSGHTAVTKHVLGYYRPDVGNILDYGSGKHPVQSQTLSDLGYLVWPHEVPENRVIGVHITEALVTAGNWDVILLSNVVNVQETLMEAVNIITDLQRFKPKVIILNLPQAPVYWGGDGPFHITRKDFEDALHSAGIPRETVHKFPYSGGMVYEIDGPERY